MKLKICGITERCDIPEIVGLNPDFLGFIFYSASPRSIANKMERIPFDLIPKHINKVAVFVNESTTAIAKIVEKYGFSYIQLHGNEKPEQCKEIQKFASVIKAFGISDTLPSNIDFYQDYCNYFLFDTKGENYGGNGLAFDHSVLSDYKLSVPFFLSGGIGPKDSGYLNQLNHSMYYAVDINSKFETAPGIKDISKIKQFTKDLNRI